MKDKLLVTYMQKLLEGIRGLIDSDNLDNERLPKWVNGANIEIMNSAGTVVYKIEPSSEETDNFSIRRNESRDVNLFLNANTVRSGAGLQFPGSSEPPEGSGNPSALTGTSNAEGGPILNIKSEIGYLFPYNNGDYHHPMILNDLYMKYIKNELPVKISYVLLAIYIHERDFQFPEESLNIMSSRIFLNIQRQHESDYSNYYEQTADISDSFTLNSNESVIVLGSYDGGKYEKELMEVRDHLRARGYSASLIKNLPGNPSKSIRHKAKVWSMGARFVVFIDQEPSGHLIEYSDISGEEVVAGILREEGSGSTWVAGHEHMTDNHIEIFRFENEPIEAIDDVCEWAEDTIEEHLEIFDEYYPSWRD
jgi:hypothetical protein